MSKRNQPAARYRNDYRAPAYSINEVELEFDLHDHKTRVSNTMQIERHTASEPLVLQGENLLLLSVHVDGVALDNEQFVKREGELVIEKLPERFELQVITEIDPANNTALEGLYKSAGTFCTQCEAEGFRRITYFMDRPDVLSVYTTTVRADRQHFPYLLSNGNPIERGDTDDGRHFVTWHDPHPKPCYLFALVAGDFDLLEDEFTTQEGRKVKLELYVDKGNREKSRFAMKSLINAMEWDEKRFNLTYDLDIYMVVAVDFFNMGAMENKGLNIFNAKYVLADPATATDQDFLNIESVIGHEYFHNWTGNRITCRDWFQLSLKEGLTVFRDQEFSSDSGMRSVNRIQDARIIRTHQFEEDASPMAHPIRPDKVVEMNNFYTVTVYNKGAEVIRMMHTLLGEEGFQRGMELYVERHDGQAVTCEDFVAAMEDANQADFSVFRRWYEQAGTPTVKVETEFDAAAQTYTLTLSQSTPSTAGNSAEKPFHIPVKAEFYTAAGEPLAVSDGEQHKGVIELKDSQQTLTLSCVNEEPVIGLLADFSAPVKVDFGCSEQQLISVIGYCSDPFLRWDAVQQLYIRAIKQAISAHADVELPEALIDILAAELSNPETDSAMKALLLQVPGQETMAAEYDQIPVDEILSATQSIKNLLAVALRNELIESVTRYPVGGYQFTSAAVANRMLVNTSLSILAAHSEDALIAELLMERFESSDNMTEQFGALQAAVHNQHPHAAALLASFAERWKGQTLVMDKWLAVQATAPVEGVLEQVQELTNHAAFDWGNPNRIYALIASFTHNPGELHRADGRSYKWLIDVISKLNSQNPQVASRLLSPLLKWKRLDAHRQSILKPLLEQLHSNDSLSSDLFEKLDQSLGE